MLPSLTLTYWKLNLDWTTTNPPVLATSWQAILALVNLSAILDMRHKTSPSLASCDFPWTALLLLAVESLLPLTVVSCFACLASVSFTRPSSGFLCRNRPGQKDWRLNSLQSFAHQRPSCRHRNHTCNWNQTPKPPRRTCLDYGRQRRPSVRQSCKLQQPQQAMSRHGWQAPVKRIKMHD